MKLFYTVFIVLMAACPVSAQGLEAFLECRYALDERDDTIKAEAIQIHDKIPIGNCCCSDLKNCMIYLTVPNAKGNVLHIIHAMDDRGEFIWNIVLMAGSEYAQVNDPQDRFELGSFKQEIRNYIERRRSQ